jgi:DNA-binding protein HU-beta
MNKAQLIDAMSARAGLTKADAKKALDAYIEITTDALKKGDRVALVGFGSYTVSERNSRTGRNPQTGQPITIGAKKVVKFKAGSELNDSVQ